MRLLFVHGSGCTGDVFAAQLRAFTGAHAPNLPGHDAPGSPASVGEFADFIASYIATHELDDVVLAGNSLGGAIALECALRGLPQVAGIVLLGSGARLRVAPQVLAGLENEFEATATSLARLFFFEPLPQRVDEAVASMKRVGQAQTLRDFRACDAFDAVERVGKLGVPLLALTGEEDRLTPPKFAQFFANRVAGAQARIVPRAGHLIMVERPEETNAELRAFVHQLR